MKTKNTIFIGFLLIFIILTGCSATEDGLGQLELIEVQKAEYGEEFLQWHSEKWNQPGAYIKAFEDGAYILIVGEQVNTGGYAIEVVSSTYEGEVAVIKVKVVPPPEDAMVTQALDYPHAILRTETKIQQVELIYE